MLNASRSNGSFPLSFPDKIVRVKDGKYGHMNPDAPRGWDGMVGELVREVSPLARGAPLPFRA